MASLSVVASARSRPSRSLGSVSLSSCFDRIGTLQPRFWHLGHYSGKTEKHKELELTRLEIEEGGDNQSQIRDEQSNVAEHESLRGGFLTENVIGNLDNLNETTRFDDWLADGYLVPRDSAGVLLVILRSPPPPLLLCREPSL